MDQNSWAVKHRPTTLDEVQGHTTLIDKLKKWADGWEPGDDPWLLHGKPGIGKTTIAKALANYMDRTISDINASDSRTTFDVELISAEMDTGRDLFFLDEVDSWPSSVDVSALADRLCDPPAPVILAANEKWNVPDSLISPCNVEKLSLSSSSIVARLRDIAEEESVGADESDLEKIARAPDLRTAINDLQLYALSDEPPGLDGRDWEVGNFGAMDELIQNLNPDVDMSPRDIVPWLDQNLSKEVRGYEAAMCYDALSRADLHLSRARPGDYRPWRWASALAKLTTELHSDPYQGWVRWDFPKAFRTNVTKAERELYDAMEYSGSMAEFRSVALPVIKSTSIERRCRLAERLGLSDDALPALELESSTRQSYAVEWDISDDTEYEGDETDETETNVLEDDW